MFNQEKAKINTVDLFNTIVLEDLVSQSYTNLITNGLSGYKYQYKSNSIVKEFSTKSTYWHKLSSSQNTKKALFESINEIITKDTNYDLTTYNVAGFTSTLARIASNIDLIKEIRNVLRRTYGYILSIEEITAFIVSLQEKCLDNYGVIYDSKGNRMFGLALRGVIGTYFETQEDFNQEGFSEDDSTVIAFKIDERDGSKFVIHDVKRLSKNEDYYRLSLSEQEIREGWRVGVCLMNSEERFDIYEQSLISLDGKKVIGRFEYDFSTNNVIDTGEGWYLDKNKWNYYNLNGEDIGIQVLSVLSVSHAGENTYVITNPKVTSQYLKYGIEYKWAENFFSHESWIIERSSNGELDEGVPMLGVNEAKEILTEEQYYSAYFALLDFKNFMTEEGSSSRRDRNPQPILNSLLGEMNVRHNLATGEVLEDTRREKSDIEAIMNSIFKSEKDILDFLFEKELNGELVEVSKEDYLDKNGNKIATLKQWIQFVVSRITSPSRATSTDSDIESLLSWASGELKKLTPLDLSTEERRRIFATDGEDSELHRGLIMLEIIIYVIGHSTFRDILTHNIAHKGIPGAIIIDILDAPSYEKLSRYCSQFALYPPQFPSERQGPDYISVESVSKYKYSLYFGDSVVYLPVKENIRDKSLNAFRLGYVPAAFLSREAILSEDNLDASLLSLFQTKYDLFMKNRYGLQSIEVIRSKVFLESSYKAFELIKSLLSSILEKSYSGSEFEHYKDFGELILRTELLSKNVDTIRGKKMIRAQLEDIIMGLENKLVFHKLNSLTIDMTSSKREIDGVFVFRKFSDYNTQIKDILNEALIKSRMSTLEGIIRDNGGKVRIFTTIDIMGKGIHLTRISETSSYNVPVPKLGTQVRSYIDIDLTSENSQELLRKVVKLSLSYTPLSGQKLYRRYGFLISSLSTGSPICLLNGDRFLKIEEIHSVDYPLRRHDIYYDTIDISHFFGAFDIDQANEDWQASNVYFPYDLSKENLDFSWGT